MGHFLDLPREVRDMIYIPYLTVEGGYILDFDSNTLRAANGEPINLALMFTCKRFAEDMRGLAFSLNTITFSTFLSKEHTSIAGRFHTMTQCLPTWRAHIIDGIRPATLSVPDDIWDDLSRAHPKFAPFLDLVRSCHDLKDRQLPYGSASPGSLGETPSVFRGFLHSVLQTIVANKHRFDADQFSKFDCGNYDSDQLSAESISNLNPSPWSIPTLQELEEMLSSLKTEPQIRIEGMFNYSHQCYEVNQLKYRYSAAAVAIRFLESLSKDSRSSIKRIVLNEDRKAVAFAECHGLGLIPYCQENPWLRVERRVSMWRTVFQTTTCCNWGSPFVSIFETTKLQARQISYPVAVWIVEALELESAGMPPGSFTLTFEGDSLCSEIFQTVVQRDAAWQAAVDLCLDRNILPPLSWLRRRSDPRNRYSSIHGVHFDGLITYLFEAFPGAIRDIVAGNSIIKCNFALGEAWDVERLAEEHKHYSLSEWNARWMFDREKEAFEPDPPSPTWAHLLCEESWELIAPLTRADIFDRWPHSRSTIRINKNSQALYFLASHTVGPSIIIVKFQSI
ncbi:hypothetical protein LZ32DRAFT_254265 [Colletotrichum eremochloae]|nr:hypothetical protein LZ32DRAFT_254265 [Colletotrichum eremochloae]